MSPDTRLMCGLSLILIPTIVYGGLEVLVCLSSASRDEVNEMVRKAVAAGGTTYKQPEDHGFMYGHGFQDLDGHIWELAFMEPSAVKTA